MRAIVGGLLVLAVLAGVAAYSYNLGVGQGVAQSGKLPAAPGPGAGPYPVYPGFPYGDPYYDHGPFGLGFFGLLWTVLLVFLVFALRRGLFWRRRGWGGSWGRGASV